MPHVLVLKALKVLSAKSAYPEVIQQDAQAIVNWDETKRQAMRAMWQKHSVLIRWIALRKQSNGWSYADRCREATRELGKTVSVADMTILHVARNHLRKTQITNAMLFGQFDARLKLLESKETELIHRYLACVNAQRADDSVAPVAFLKWCGMPAVCEILAWKMLPAQLNAASSI